MYATNTIIKNSKKSGRIIGTHQRINRVARKQLSEIIGARARFPKITSIQYFEGTNGPDGIKRKSPGVDEPWHMIEPDSDDGRLIECINNHSYNLTQALKNKDDIRASFEAAWLSHAIVDGLTPAHHYPYEKEKAELKKGRDFLRLFTIETKGIMPGDNSVEVIKNNWLYWGAKGLFVSHVSFEFGVAFVVSSTRADSLRRLPTKKEISSLRKHGFNKMFYKSLKKINKLGMYNYFLKNGWTVNLAVKSQKELVPEIIKCVTLAWLDAYQRAEE